VDGVEEVGRDWGGLMLELLESLKVRAKSWQCDADRMDRYAEGPVSRTLRVCAQDLLAIVEEHQPTWVSIRDVRATTGQSLQSLRRRCQEFEDLGLARKARRGWEMSLIAAQEIPKRGEPVILGAGESLEDLARRLGRDPG